MAESQLPGVLLLTPSIFSDSRGSLVKTYHAGLFAEFGVKSVFAEEFFSCSAKGVLRGMHSQRPPHDHEKLVYCIRGRVLDVLLDLRQSSTTFGQSISTELSAANRRMFYIPRGLAHGFLALEDDSVLIYKTTTVHAPGSDFGIRWDSFGFDWGVTTPIVSLRDAGFTRFPDFASPFI